tara:strand:+ start:40 stop:513 length:474 start_codon:yes stop_codon:yes gene_type:complete
MLIQFQEYLTVGNIYLWINLGVLPFWLMIILIPGSKITQIFVNSIIIPLVLSSAYFYIIYQGIFLKESLFEILKLYLSLDNLYTVFATESFLLIFWIHFVGINLFLGSWISRDAIKYNISKKLVFIPMLLVFFTGLPGLLFYWFFRIFFAKKLGIHD